MPSNRSRKEPDDLRFAVGIEDTFVPQTAPGRRALDLYELTGHYENWRADLDLAAASGAAMIRYGVPWYRVNPEPETWDWSWTDEVFDHMLALGLIPIVDLMHYGCPLWLEREFANPDYPERVSRYARRFAGRYGDRIRHYTPLNEPLINAIYCGEDGRWPPMLTGDTGFVALTKQLARGVVMTQRGIRDTVPAAVLVHVEATFRYANSPAHAERIRFLEERSYLFYDLFFGRVGEDHQLRGYLSRNGFTDEDFAYFRDNPAEPDVLGLNYYPHMTTVELLPGGGRRGAWCGAEGLEELIRAFHARYERPIFITETSVPGPPGDRIEWLDESLEMVRRLRDEGLPVVGYTWWPLFSLVDWDYREGRKPAKDYLWHMGLHDLAHYGEGKEGKFARVETLVAGAFRAAARGMVEKTTSGRTRE